jgi:hypothetical protein
MIEDMIDLLYYIEDVFLLENEQISRVNIQWFIDYQSSPQIFANALLSYAILPAIVGSLGSLKKVFAMMNLSLNILSNTGND